MRDGTKIQMRHKTEGTRACVRVCMCVRVCYLVGYFVCIVERALQCLCPESDRVRERLKIPEREDKKCRAFPKKLVERDQGR